MNPTKPFFNIVTALALTALMTSTAVAEGFGAPSLSESVAPMTDPVPIWTGFYNTETTYGATWNSSLASQGVGFTSPGGTTTVEATTTLDEIITTDVNIVAGPGCDPLVCPDNSVFFNGEFTASTDASTYSIATGGGLSTAPVTANAQSMSAGQFTGGVWMTQVSTDVPPPPAP